MRGGGGWEGSDSAEEAGFQPRSLPPLLLLHWDFCLSCREVKSPDISGGLGWKEGGSAGKMSPQGMEKEVTCEGGGQET